MLVVRHRMLVVTCSKWDSIHIVANTGVDVQHSHLKQRVFQIHHTPHVLPPDSSQLAQFDTNSNSHHTMGH